MTRTRSRSVLGIAIWLSAAGASCGGGVDDLFTQEPVAGGIGISGSGVGGSARAGKKVAPKPPQ